jgi:imidazolonepropionase-like amidohydrolase
MDMIVREANLAKAPVAAHCCTLEGAMGAIKAGVKTMECGWRLQLLSVILKDRINRKNDA